MTDSSQSWEHGAHYTACRQLNRLESALSKRFRCSKTLPGCRVAFHLLQTTVLVSESSLHFFFLLGQSTLKLSFLCLSGTLSFCGLLWQGRHTETGHIQELPEATWSCLPSCLRNFPAECSVSISEETAIQQHPVSHSIAKSSFYAF